MANSTKTKGKKRTPSQEFQGTLFEDGFLVRLLGRIASDADVALLELVANAWDAGAGKVSISIPESKGGEIVITDDGAGLTPEQFHHRWMTLGYNRVKHQGTSADLPPERKSWKRRAYGRNGLGRHGLLFFADEYVVETTRDGQHGRFIVGVSSGESPFILKDEQITEAGGHGTRLTAVTEHRPDPDRIRENLSMRFLHDPQFVVEVNGKSVTLADHSRLLDRDEQTIGDDVTVELFTLRASDNSRTRMPSGIAFWVGSRLVGKANWRLGEKTLLDGRSSFAKGLAVVVKSDGLFDLVEADWTGFREDPVIEELYSVVESYMQRISSQFFSDRVSENKKVALRDNKEALAGLGRHARVEVVEFLNQVAEQLPTAAPELVSVAVKAVINLEKTRSGQDLLRKLSELSHDDVAGINQLLDSWTVKDALAVLDEIDRRMSVIDALGKLMGDPSADELHTIHPLVAYSRWLFGPEYDSPVYSSNVTIRTAAEKIFEKKIDATQISNPRQRPDLIFLKNSTLSFVGTEEFGDDGTVVSLKRLLLVELKRGRSTIGRDEMRQAQDYVEDIMNCGLLDGTPSINAFVVGHSIDGRIQKISVGDPAIGKVEPCTYGQLVRTARIRLFKLNEQISNRYENLPALELVNRVLEEKTQQELLDTEEGS